MMIFDGTEIHNRLNPALSKIELLCRFALVLDSDREYVQALGLILEMVGDYAHTLRQQLEALVREVPDER